MRIAYFDCFSGISGDMVIASFLDSGLDLKILARELKKLKISGYELKKTKVRRGEIVGTKFDCVVKSRAHGHNNLKSILALIDKSALNKKVRDTARDIFLAIGKAEAKIHGYKSLSGVHFHELGDIDSIVDIVGTAIALDILGIGAVYASKINMGSGIVNTKVGPLPVPSPASLELLKGVPVKISDIDSELVTPTGAGILKAVSKGFGEMPRMEISNIGYGAGAKDIRELPNMLRVMIGETRAAFKEDKIFVIETNIDDMSPQGFEYLFEVLFKAGALDVYTSSIYMKKSRPALKLTVLAEPPALNKISGIIFNETTSIGVRFHEANRFKLERVIVKAATKFGKISVKLSSGPAGDVLTISPEYDECVRIAKNKGIPLKVVYDEAKAAVRV